MAGVQGLNSFLERCIDEDIKDVASAAQEALSTASHEHTFSRIRRCLDQLGGKIADRVLVNFI
jgi:hypothetical protein